MSDVAVVQQQPGIDPAVLEKVIGHGDLSALSSAERVNYIGSVCKSLGMNPLTIPFSIQKLGDKVVLYAKKDAGDQLRRIYNVSITILSREKVDDLIIVTARASMPDGRTDEAIGAVNTLNLRGENLANSYMKAETKAKRRVTLSICGLGIMDETEVDSVLDIATKPLPQAPPKPWTNRKEMLVLFKAEKDRIGDELFFRILGSENIEDAKGLQDDPVAVRLYGELRLVQSAPVAEAEVVNG